MAHKSPQPAREIQVKFIDDTQSDKRYEHIRIRDDVTTKLILIMLKTLRTQNNKSTDNEIVREQASLPLSLTLRYK